MQQFKVGQRIKCVRGPFPTETSFLGEYKAYWKVPEIGEVYTVRDYDHDSVLLRELVNFPHPDLGEIQWFNWHFEPLAEENVILHEQEEELVTSSHSLVHNLQKQTTMRLTALILGLFIPFLASAKIHEYNNKEYLPVYRQIEEKVAEGDWDKASKLLFRHFPDDHESPRALTLEALIKYHGDGTKRERMGYASGLFADALLLEERLRYLDEVDPEVSLTTFMQESFNGFHPVFYEFYNDLFDYVERIHTGDHSLAILEAVALASEDVYYMPWYCEACRTNGVEPKVFNEECQFMQKAERFYEHYELLYSAYPYDVIAFEDTVSGGLIWEVGGYEDEPPAGFISYKWQPDIDNMTDYMVLIHEAVHHKNEKLTEDLRNVYAYYLSTTEVYKTSMIEPVSGYELVKYIPDSVQDMLGMTFDFYINDHLEEMGTTYYGIYGLMDELNAYMFETRALFDVLSTLDFDRLTKDQQQEIGFLIEEKGLKLQQFNLCIAFYLRMAQERHPILYNDLLGTPLLQTALRRIYGEYRTAIVGLYEYVGDREVFPTDLRQQSEALMEYTEQTGVLTVLRDFVNASDPRLRAGQQMVNR